MFEKKEKFPNRKQKLKKVMMNKTISKIIYPT